MALEHYTILETHSIEMFTIHILDNGITHVEVAGDTVVDVKHLKAQYEFFKSRYDGKTKFSILVESGYDSTLTKEAREYTSLPETNAMTKATAVVVKSLAERLIINFIINIISRQAMTLRLFDTKENAMNWLLSQKDSSTPTRQARQDKLSSCL
jgi:hypothetical protein